MPALRVCMMFTFSRSTWLKAKRTILARSPFTRDSSVMASRRSMGRRSVMPGRLSVHRCPSRFTFGADFVVGFFAAFLTAFGRPFKAEIHSSQGFAQVTQATYCAGGAGTLGAVACGGGAAGGLGLGASCFFDGAMMACRIVPSMRGMNSTIPASPMS